VPPFEKPVIVTRSVSTFSSARASARSASTTAPAFVFHHIPFAWERRPGRREAPATTAWVWAVGIAAGPAAEDDDEWKRLVTP